jgi:hypothetical protein
MDALGIALIVGGLTLICGGLVFLLFRRDEPPISQESFEQDGACTENLIRVDAVMESPKLAE